MLFDEHPLAKHLRRLQPPPEQHHCNYNDAAAHQHTLASHHHQQQAQHVHVDLSAAAAAGASSWSSQVRYWNWWNVTTAAASGWCERYLQRFDDYLTDALEHLAIFALLYTVASLLLYALIVKWRVLRFRRDVSGGVATTERPRRVLFVMAHPDDETMFFGPSVLRFTQDASCSVYLLCLSTGANYGMGKVRKRELYEACKVLGIRDECIMVQTHTRLPDAMDVQWPAEVVAAIISHHLDAVEIDTLITFDKHGVSRHLNHCSIYYAVALLSTERKLPKDCHVYVLETINVIRKYWRLFDIPICYLLSSVRFITSSHDRRLLHTAMTRHKSQFVWFRKLFVFFSRYQLINTLQRMDASDIQLDLEIDD